MPVPFIHLADVHLGRLHGRGLAAAQLAQRRTDAMQTLLRVLENTRAQHIPLLMIVGDLFEHETVDKSTVQEVRDRLAAMPDAHVFIAAGNHDYAAEESFYRTLVWPDNVHLFLGDWETVPVDELEITVHGCGFATPERPDANLRNLCVPMGNGLQIVMMHADITSGGSRYMPVAPQDLAACPADYIALGHVHTPLTYLPGKQQGYGLDEVQNRHTDTLVHAAYSGALEPVDYGDAGLHGYWQGELAPGGAKLQFVQVAARTYRQVRVDVSGVQTMGEVQALVEANLTLLPSTDLVRLLLIGTVPTGFSCDQTRLAPLGQRFFAWEVIDATIPDEDPVALAAGHSVKAVFARRMLALLENAAEEEREQTLLALRFGLDALAGREVHRL